MEFAVGIVVGFVAGVLLVFVAAWNFDRNRRS